MRDSERGEIQIEKEAETEIVRKAKSRRDRRAVRDTEREKYS